jgi:tRNA(Arg) A34 adenosine deaminase TadA
MIVRQIALRCPDWIEEIDFDKSYPTDAERMGLAIEVSRLNVARQTGGPFGAAIFADDRLVACGMNLVLLQANSTAHAEMVAFQLAQAQRKSHRLTGCSLYASCEPCAMCLGATLWSGVSALFTAATGEDARAIGFDEGPVFDASWAYLADRGLRITRGLERTGAKQVLDLYARQGGVIYNG